MKYIFFLAFCIPFNMFSAVFEVGPTRTYTSPSQVMSLVDHGDTVLVDAGDYFGDVGVWNKNNLVIKGRGGYAHLHADGNDAQGKAIWVVKGDDMTIEYIEFSECTVQDRNGAGIRHEGTSLTLRHCKFHHNEMGILANNNPDDHVLIEYSEFYENGFGDGLSHSVYINHSASLTIRYSYFRQVDVGHHVKSRASMNTIEYNKIDDEAGGNSSRLIDLPNGGNTIIRGNILIQSAAAENGNLIGYGLEGLNEPTEYFLCINNTMVSYRHAATFFHINGILDSTLVTNNIIAGPGTLVNGELYFENMFMVEDIDSVMFNDPSAGQYELTALSPAINAGQTYGLFLGLESMPTEEYVYEGASMNRVTIDQIDLGAHEYATSSISEQETSSESLLFYPSVTSEYLNFYSAVGHVEVTEINTGQRQVIRLNDQRLRVSNFQPGLYIIRAGGLVQRFIKTRQ